MKSTPAISMLLGGSLALLLLADSAACTEPRRAEDAAGGADLSSLASGSAGNAAGVVEFCVKNNFLGGDAASSVKDKLMGKVTGSDATETDKADYADGAKGLVKTGDGKSIDLGNLGGGQMGGLKDSLTKKACASVLDHAKSFL